MSRLLRELKHIQETLQLLSVMSNDHRFDEVYKNDTEGGIRNMCDVLDRIELKGRQEGLQEGKIEAKKEIAISLAGRVELLPAFVLF